MPLSDYFDEEEATYIESCGFSFEPIGDTPHPYADEFHRINKLWDHPDPERRIGWFWEMISLWEKVNREWGSIPHRPDNLKADLMKSCLLRRLMIERKPPLRTAPPTHLSAPVYEWGERLEAAGMQFVRRKK